MDERGHISAGTRNLTDDLSSKGMGNLKLKAFSASIDKGNRLPLLRRTWLFLLFDLAIHLKAFSWIIHHDTRIAMCRLVE